MAARIVDDDILEQIDKLKRFFQASRQLDVERKTEETVALFA
jgi:hypothetical protein